MNRAYKALVASLVVQRDALLQEAQQLDGVIQSIEALPDHAKVRAFDTNNGTPQTSPKKGGWKWSKKQRDALSRRTKRYYRTHSGKAGVLTA